MSSSGLIKICVSVADFNDMVNRLTFAVNVNVDAMRVEKVTWGDQFRNALNVNGGDVDNATHTDYVMHVLTFGWKASQLIIIIKRRV